MAIPRNEDSLNQTELPETTIRRLSQELEAANFKLSENDKEIRYVQAEVEKLHAIELLEYHAKNWLPCDDKVRNESKRKVIERILDKLGTTSTDKI